MSRKRIAVLMASVDREYQQDFAAGLASAGAKLDVDICIFNSQGHMNIAVSTSEAGENQIYDLVPLSEFDGIISMPATMGSEKAVNKVFDTLKELKGKPHVSIDVVQEDAVTILFDDKISVEEMTEHLISEHGARRIAFVSGPLSSNVAMDRVDACRHALEKHGLVLDDKLLFDGDWTRSGGRRAAEEIIRMGGELPDAVMCGNDDMALSVIECFNEIGIQVPQDIAVTGFDALRESVMRGLTTICRPIDRSARKAIEILTAWIDGEVPMEKRVTLSTIPIFGDTCGCTLSVEHINDKLRTLGMERWNMETILTRVSMFSNMMAGVGDEAEAREKIQSFVRSWDIRELYLCVDPSICRETAARQNDGAYPDQMLLLYGNRNGKEYAPQYFPIFDLTPSLHDIRKNSSCLVFCPLYYRDRSFGYVAMELGNGTGSALYPALMLLNGTLMSLYLQTNIKKSASTIERMANHDIMTGLLNRRGYMQLAPVMLKQARKDGKVFALLSADMNHMKDINDRFGHLAGDEAICRMGRALRVVSQKGMIPVHISGDEFLAYGLLDSTEEADAVIPMVNEELKRINHEDPWLCDIGASLGIFAEVPVEEDSIDSFMTQADREMYADKNKFKYGRRKEDFEKEQNGQ
ncbi:MAG: GGDEF domain-containing protein [Eubacteriales bacterium]